MRIDPWDRGTKLPSGMRRMTEEEMADRLLKALAEQAREDFDHEADVVQAERTAGMVLDVPTRRRLVELLAQRGALVVLAWEAGHEAAVRLTVRGLTAARL